MSSQELKQPYWRVRSRGSFYPADRSGQWYNSTQNPLPAPVVASISGSRGTTEWMSDYVTPAFIDLSRKGHLVNNDLLQITQTRSTTTSGPKFQTTIGGVVYTGDLVGPHWTTNVLTGVSRPAHRPDLSADIENAATIASTRAFANISKPTYTGLVTLGELRQTLGYLKNPFASGIKLADSLARLSRKSGLTRGKTRRDAMYSRNDVIKDFAAIHLSILYGFKPLVTEVVGILENLRPRAVPRPQRQTSRSKEIRVLTDSWVSQETFGGISYTASYEWTQEVTVTVGFLYQNIEEMMSEEQWGLRPKDVVPAAWAVMSKSFVVDWFINVGDFISSLIPSAGTRVLLSWRTIKTKTTLKRTVSNYQFSNWTTTRPGVGVDTVVVTEVNRRHYAPPVALAMKDLTALKNDISRLTSMISMLTGTLKSARNPPSVTKKTKTGRILEQSQWY